MTEQNAGGSDFAKSDSFATQYDHSARTYGWHSPEILFGLIYELVQPGDALLDLGIGTGLSAIPFKKAGLEIHGLDGSREMLRHCEKRGVAVDLKQHDILATPLPYSDSNFDHVIACGVFHLMERIEGIFAETARLMRGGGAFAFTFEELTPDFDHGGRAVEDGVLEIHNEKSGVSSYLHSRRFVEDLLSRNGFTTAKTLNYVAYLKTDWADERTFRAFVAQRNETP